MKPQDLVRPEILALKAYHVPASDGMVKLDAMENPYTLPEPLRRELADVLARQPLPRAHTPRPQPLRPARPGRTPPPPVGRRRRGTGAAKLMKAATPALPGPGASTM